MTITDPPPQAPQTSPARQATATGGVFRSFDLLDSIGRRIAQAADVPLPARAGDAPRLDADLVVRAARAIAHDPVKRRLFSWYAAGVAVFSAVVVTLLANGMLGAAYERLWRWHPGRPWTHVMRDNPWIYVVLAAVLAVVPFLLAPRGRWGRAFLTYVIFLVGFLGGHVFW